MTVPNLVMNLSAVCNVKTPTNLVATDRMTACRWRHSNPEFPDAILPANTLVLTMCNVASYRLQSGRITHAAGTPNGMGLIAEGSDGRWIFGSDVDVFHFYFSNAMLSCIAGREDMVGVELRDQLVLDDPVLKTMAMEAAGAASEGEHSELYADTLGLAMALRLLRAHRSGTGHVARQTNAMASGGMTARNLRRVTDYLMSHLSEDVSLLDLAAVAGLSPFHFCRAFKRTTGLSPHAWLLARRVEVATRMMLDTPAMGLAEIALSVGFETQSGFSTAFKRERGMSPSQWRRLYAI